MSLLNFTCTYYYAKGKSADVKLNFTTETTTRRRFLEFNFSRIGSVKLELEDLIKCNYEKKENVLQLVLVAKILTTTTDQKQQINDGQQTPLATTIISDQKSFTRFVYDQLMTTKVASQKMENTLERISSIFTLGKMIDGNRLEFEFKAEVTGDWNTYSKKFNEIVGSFSKIEDKPMLYEIGKEFFFDKRDATASLNGYLYQVDLALNYWIDTLENPNNCVMIEFGEDVAIIPLKLLNEIENFKKNVKIEEGGQDSQYNLLVFDQAKLYKEMISFNSDCICDIFLNFFTTCGKAVDSSSTTITYRLTTSTTIENLSIWKAKGDKAMKMLQDLIEQHEKKRLTNSLKIRYQREAEDWVKFVNYCKKDWEMAVETLSRVEFIENMTPEILSQQIENKLKHHLEQYTNNYGCDLTTRLRNQLFGMIKSQLLESRGGDNDTTNSKILDPQKLKQVIDKEIQTCQQVQDLKDEIEKLKSLLLRNK